MLDQVIKKLSDITSKKHFLFMDKCRDAAELLMILAKQEGFDDLIIQEEGGWYTYEKSAARRCLNVIKAPVSEGKLIKKDFPFQKALVLLNSSPGYAFVDDFPFLDEMKSTGSLFVNDIAGSIGEDYSKKGDILIGSFGKDKPVSIESGGAFIALDDDYLFDSIKSLKQEFFKDSGANIKFDELFVALNNVFEKKNAWIKLSNKIKEELLSKGFHVLNPNESINVLVKLDDERENLIKFCEENNLPYRICPLYIRTLDDAVSIEIKKLNVEG